LEWHGRRHNRRINGRRRIRASFTARLPPAAAILGKTVKKRAVTVATDTSACCDNGRHDQPTGAKRYAIRTASGRD
jgi:hypothetical protein